MKVYLPSWNGDFRLESDGEGCKLILHEPTPFEMTIIDEFLRKANKKGWGPRTKLEDSPQRRGDTRYVMPNTTLANASKLLIKIARPKKQTLTAISFEGGKMSVVEGTSEGTLQEISKTVEAAEASEKSGKGKAAAASVKRPTPSCPSCRIGSVAPASEVLLAFLNDEEHESWRRQRAIIVAGGLTGHRYMLAHRHSPLAARVGRMCYDIDDNVVVHFHDNTVPPEEEVLAAKLVLEHREPWLRNEATILGGGRDVFKNPFGGFLDGVESASFASVFGGVAKRLLQ